MQITFLGATETVTGSRFLVESGRTRVLVDCGMFQGLKRERARNREELPFDLGGIDAVLLTHAHLDHSGLVPRLAKLGYARAIHATAGTRDLLEILWPDAAQLQEEDARFANERGFSKHKPALALYGIEDARRALDLVTAVPRGGEVVIGSLRARFSPVGHIVGASAIRIDDGRTSVLFSGDVGRPDDVLMQPPAPPPAADYVVVESTYAGRAHPRVDPVEALASIVERTVARGGMVVVPAFAVGRAQAVMHLLGLLREQGRLGRVSVVLDSPMAERATQVYLAHADEQRLSPAELERLARVPTFARDVASSRRALEDGPRVVISASGMATGGRVLHHLERVLPDPASTVLLVGFQAAGTRGETLLAGANSVKMHGQYVPVRCEIARIDGLSAHADGEELLGWLGAMPSRPRRAFAVHGEPAQCDAMRRTGRDRLGWDVVVPKYGETYRLE